MSSLTRAEEAHLARAVRVAEESTCRQKHGAVVALGRGRVLAVGVNSFRSHPMHVTDPKREASFHAEVAVLRQLNYDVNDGRSVLFVARVNRLGEPMLSMPCPECRIAIAKAGVGKVVYTGIEGGFGVYEV